MSRQPWLAAVITAAALAGWLAIPGYGNRVATALRQVVGIPLRLSMDLEAIRLDALREPYAVIARVRKNTFDDAVILITDDPADPFELRSIAWCAYYLYPRVLVHRAALERHPELEADFVLTTPRFAPGFSDTLEVRKFGLLPVSERARRYADERWTP